VNAKVKFGKYTGVPQRIVMVGQEGLGSEEWIWKGGNKLEFGKVGGQKIYTASMGKVEAAAVNVYKEIAQKSLPGAKGGKAAALAKKPHTVRGKRVNGHCDCTPKGLKCKTCKECACMKAAGAGGTGGVKELVEGQGRGEESERFCSGPHCP
jgi:hypothetical protein